MDVVLVTGATGCVGSNLAICLVGEGYKVRAFHRPTSAATTLNGVDVAHCAGDIRDKASLLAAMEGCDTVFHTAAIVSFWKKRHGEQMQVNVDGTRNVVEACLAVGVRKLVHTSSVAALGHRSDGKLIDETTAFNWKPQPGYRYSKHLSEAEIRKGLARGLDATIVNPTVIIGPRDPRFHGGQIIRNVARGFLPGYTDGGMNVVSAADVARGHLLAAQKGKTGERYILAGRNMTYREIFDLTARILGKRPPRFKLPLWFVKSLARALDIGGTALAREPWITPELVATIGTNHWYSDEKARRELGYLPTSIEQAVRDAYDWYRTQNLL